MTPIPQIVRRVVNVMKTPSGRILVWTILISCTISFSSCGYFLYPDRRGQTQGEIDVPVLILDCVGLFFFIVPGVAALLVDFSSGAIHLPNNNKKSALKKIPFDNRRAHDRPYLESLISHHIGQDVRLDDGSVRWIKIDEATPDYLEEILKRLNAHIDDKSTLDQFAELLPQGSSTSSL